MLEFNAKHFAKNDAEYAQARAAGNPRLTGFYDASDKNGFKLYDHSHTLRAFIHVQQKAVVTAHTVTVDGKPRDRFMFGASEIEERWLGFERGSLYSAEKDAIRDLREFDPRDMKWVIYNPAEYSASDGGGFWSNDIGWVDLKSATRFNKAEVMLMPALPSGAGPSQTLEIGTMQDFRIMVVESPDNAELDQTPILFQCFAEDMEHAKEQAENAYPGCEVLGREDDVEETPAPGM